MKFMIENVIMIILERGQRQVRYPSSSLTFIHSLTSFNNHVFNLLIMFPVIIRLTLIECKFHKGRDFCVCFIH